MIVSKTHKFVYFDVPKTASTSLDELFTKYGGVLIRPPSNLAKHNRIVPDYASDYTKIVSVRNPYDRATSHYFMAIKNKTRVPTNSFEEYLDYCISTLEYPTDTKDGLIYHFFPIWKILGEWLDKVEYVIRFEHLEEDINKIPFISRNIMNGYIKLPHKNKSEHRKFDEIKTPSIIEKINIWAKKDFEIFGYEKCSPV